MNENQNVDKTVDAQEKKYTFSKSLTINLGGYESVKLGVNEALSFEDCDKILIGELKRIAIPLTPKIRQCLQWRK